ncbi:MAG: insulinase family protein [Cellulomonas sp.]|uniref:M16 family metallopeptidase n=1 Tax=Cellulomonas sp. TaxID=40001 RepID=UPI0019E14282|nr:insulinase family protein [Cellulomonas sp.]MBF0688255.1 insulinase family protein [Cellulomonas sp.]
MSVDLSLVDSALVPSPAGLRVPPTASARTPAGTDVVVVALPVVPLVELRVRVPLGQAPPAQAALLAHSLLHPRRTVAGEQLDVIIRRLGGTLHASVDADALHIRGTCLAGSAAHALRLVLRALSTLTEDDVRAQVPEAAQMSAMAHAGPSLAALETLNLGAYGTAHPYGRPSAAPQDVLAVDPQDVLELAYRRVGPDGATVVLAGDLDVDRALDDTAEALATWAPAGPPLRPVPVPHDLSGPVLLNERPGQVHTCLRAVLTVVGRTDPSYAALKVANLVLGGYFSSRLVHDLRERRGASYGAQTAFVHAGAGSLLLASVDVAATTSADGLVALGTALDDVVDRPVTPDELVHARGHAVGAQILTLARQSSVADWAVELAQDGHDLHWVAEHVAQLADVGLADVHAAAAAHLGSARAALAVTADDRRRDALQAAATALGRELRTVGAH